jgi:hypothetical protein
VAPFCRSRRHEAHRTRLAVEALSAAAGTGDLHGQVGGGVRTMAMERFGRKGEGELNGTTGGQRKTGVAVLELLLREAWRRRMGLA